MRNLTPRQRKSLYDVVGPLTLVAVAFGWVTQSQGAAIVASALAILSAAANFVASANVTKVQN